MLLEGNLWVFGELSGSPFLCQKWSILGSGLASGLANWTCIFQKLDLQKWGKTHNDSLGRKTTTLPLYVQETYPFSTSVFGAYTLLYIVYRGFLAYFSAFQGEGEHTRGTFWGCTIFPEPGK